MVVAVLVAGVYFGVADDELVAGVLIIRSHNRLEVWHVAADQPS